MQVKLNVDFQEALGAIKNDITRGGGKGYPKLVTKSVLVGSGVHAISEITSKKICIRLKMILCCIFLVFKYTLGRRLGTGFIDL